MTTAPRLLLSLLLLLVPATARAGIPIEGKVLGPDGQGLAGARVEIRPVLRVHEQGVRDLEGRGEPEPAAKTVTGVDGWYRIETPREGIWRVMIAAPGFVAMDSTPMAVIAETSLQDLSMKPDAGLLVRVEGADGKPVAGARVAAEMGSRGPWGSWHPARRAGVSGADGTLRLPRSGEETLGLSVLAPGYAPGREAEVDRGSLTIRLRPGRPLKLRTYDQKPVPGAVVRDAASLLPIGRTDAGGVLFVDAPAAGSWDLRVDARDGRLAPFMVPELPEASRELPLVRVLILPPLIPLAGRAVDWTAGSPVAGALVWPLEDPAAFMRTDASGAFRLAWTAKTWTWLRVEGEGFFPAQDSFFLDVKSPAAPSLVLYPSSSLAGATVDEHGRPVAGAEVRAFSSEEGRLREVARVRSSEEGRFRMSGLGHGGSYELLAAAPGLAPSRESVTLGQGAKERSGLRLVLGPGRSVRGRVVDPSGQPVAGAEVELARSANLEIRPSSLVEGAVDDGLYLARTGPDGSFRVAALPAGWFDLEVRSAGFLPLTLAVDTDAGPDLGTLRLRAGATVEGRVAGPDGEPLAGAQVWLPPGPDASDRAYRRFLASGPAAVTGPDGRFVLSGLPPADLVDLEVCQPGFATSRVQEAPEPPIEIRLQPAFDISGQVVDPDGEPAPDAAVTARFVRDLSEIVLEPVGPCPGTGSYAEARTDALGRYRLESLQAGGYLLVASAAGHLASDELGVQVQPGWENAGPVLALKRGAVLAGRVLTAEGAAAAGASVGTAALQTRADGDGRFRISGVAPGPLPVSAWHPEHGQAMREIEIVPGENLLDFTLEPRAKRTLQGRVVDPDGEPAEGALVEARDESFGGGHVYTGPDGSFAIDVGAKGGFSLLARKDGYSPARLDDRAVEGATEGLELRLERMAVLSGRILGVAPEDLPRVTLSAVSRTSARSRRSCSFASAGMSRRSPC